MHGALGRLVDRAALFHTYPNRTHRLPGGGTRGSNSRAPGSAKLRRNEKILTVSLYLWARLPMFRDAEARSAARPCHRRAVNSDGGPAPPGHWSGCLRPSRRRKRCAAARRAEHGGRSCWRGAVVQIIAGSLPLEQEKATSRLQLTRTSSAHMDSLGRTLGHVGGQRECSKFSHLAPRGRHSSPPAEGGPYGRKCANLAEKRPGSRTWVV